MPSHVQLARSESADGATRSDLIQAPFKSRAEDSTPNLIVFFCLVAIVFWSTTIISQLGNCHDTCHPIPAPPSSGPTRVDVLRTGPPSPVFSLATLEHRRQVLRRNGSSTLAEGNGNISYRDGWIGQRAPV